MILVFAPLIVTDERDEHSMNAPRPMVITELGMFTEDRPRQRAKALRPMVLTEFGMLMLVRLWHP